MEQKKYYIAYGSNLNIQQMGFRCPGARVVGTSIIKGYRLMFKGSKTGSYLTIEKAEGYEVPVAVWSVTPFDEEKLDRYEGYPNFYYKKKMVIDIKGICSGKIYRREAFVYIMHEERQLGIPTKEYVSTCLIGYHEFEFDISFLKDALNYSMEVETNGNKRSNY